MRKSRRQKLKNADEYDLLFWRPVLKYFERSGVAKKIKRRLNKRYRQEGKKEIEKVLNDEPTGKFIEIDSMMK